MSDFLSVNPEHSGVTDEQMEQFFNSHPDLRPLPPVGQTIEGGSEESTPEPPSTPPEAPEPGPGPQPAPSEGEPETTPEPATPEPSPESPDGFVELGGQRYPQSQVEAATQFQQHLSSDPQLQRLITDYLTGIPPQTGQIPQSRTTPSEPAISVQPPADIDFDDPSLRSLYGLIQQQNEQINALSQGLTQTYEQSVVSQRQQINSQWSAAAETFAKDHELKDEEVEYLGQVAARLQVLPSLMQGVDPITGSPAPPDPVRAFSRALEIAMFQIPEYRDREFRRSVQSQQQEAQKRKLLGAVGGSSGSVARTNPPPKPGSPEAKRAMLAEVGAMLNGEWTDPNAN
jgi:hypothetical protein